MTPCKIVLSNSEDDEHELGVYSQGVIFQFSISGQVDVIDVASSEVVVIQTYDSIGHASWVWGREIGPYSQLFVHAVEQAMSTGNVHLVELEPFSTRTHNLMRRYRYQTLEDVCEESERYMRGLPGVGSAVLEEIRMSLVLYGLDFAPDRGGVQPSIETISRPVGRQKVWTRERVDAAIQAFFEEHGRLPKASEWRLTDGSHPATNTVQKEYGSWNAAMEANGTARPVGHQREER